MNLRYVVLLACFGAVGAEQSGPVLIAGAVRDQFGAPVANASITVGGGPALGRTSEDGTVSIELSHSTRSVLVDCAYCERSRADVADDGTFVVIVHRYAALDSAIPTDEDVAHLPYARAESLLSLHPFVVLEEGTSPIPGPQLSDHIANESGGLVAIDGIAGYDVVANTSPLETVPLRFATGVTSRPAVDAYNYGDVADRGTYALTSNGGPGLWTGTSTQGRGGIVTAGSLSSAGFSAGSGDDRQRADIQLSDAGLAGITTLRVQSGRGAFAQSEGTFGTSLSSAQLGFQQTQGMDVTAQVNAYRGSYALSNSSGNAWAAWSDVNSRLEVQSHAIVAPFTIFRLDSSTGTYGSNDGSPSRTINVQQAQFEAGIRTSLGKTRVLAAAGSNSVDYYGSYPYPDSQNAAPGSNVIAVTSDVSERWSIEASSSLNYRLPTLLQLDNSVSSGLPIANERVTEATVSYGDLRRLRASVTGFSQRSFGTLNRNDGSVGLSAAWQAAPRISLRAWGLALSDLYAHRTTIGSAWLTYAAPGARLDLVWRRDLLDGAPYAHLDAALSGPITRRVEWFAGSEGYQGRRTLSVGARIKD